MSAAAVEVAGHREGSQVAVLALGPGGDCVVGGHWATVARVRMLASGAGSPARPLPLADRPGKRLPRSRVLSDHASSDGVGVVTIQAWPANGARCRCRSIAELRRRAVLILRDVMEWPASQVAGVLDTTPAAVNSALQRAHATMASHLPVHDRAGPPGPAATERERSLVNTLIATWERADASAVAALLRDDARLVMPPTRSWFDGREAITAFFAGYAFGPGSVGRFAAVAPGTASPPSRSACKAPAPARASRSP